MIRLTNLRGCLHLYPHWRDWAFYTVKTNTNSVSMQTIFGIPADHNQECETKPLPQSGILLLNNCEDTENNMQVAAGSFTDSRVGFLGGGKG